MENYLIYIGIIIAVLVIVVIVFLIKDKKVKTSINMDEIVTLFNKNDVVNVEFIRNKIVINFKDVTKFDIDLLHSTYAKGITIVGDKIKFYVSEDFKTNEKVFYSIKQFIER